MTLFPLDDTAPQPTALDGPSVRVRMVVAYDGSGFHGFAPNPGVKTVAGLLIKNLERILGHTVFLTCAGRTDAGVHAWGQVVTFDAREEGLDLARLQRSLNRICGPAVVVRSIEVAPPDFDARRSAIGRRYRYTVLNRPVADPLLANRVWFVEEPLELAAMRLACDPLIGEHDFTSFCRVPRGVDTYSMVRNVRDARWHDLGDGLFRFDIEASSFCQQMVRAIVGLMVDIGRGHRRAGDVAGIIRARDRAAASPLAPPYGLVLWEVVYPTGSYLSSSTA